jgi:hypothetical protein
LQQKE